MHTATGLPLSRLSLLRMVCAVFFFCAVTATASSAQSFASLVSFDEANGGNPYSSLVQGADGNFYGTTPTGGANYPPYGGGTVFRMTARGVLTTLYSFCAQPRCADGWEPFAGLVLGNDGNFYGTTTGGGTSNIGTFFKITPGGTLTTLYSFEGGSDAHFPGPLIQVGDGNFYGTSPGEPNEYGNVFTLTSSASGWFYTDIYDFTGFNDGGAPQGGLVQATDGSFYGTTSVGGDIYRCGGGCGTVFKITAAGTLTTLHSFSLTDGAYPRSGLVQATDGNLYGTTEGGEGSSGTVFKITPGGTLTTLHSFDGADGAQPFASLIQATDGNFYGTTATGGNDMCSFGCGTVFKITPGGDLTTLHSLDGTDGWDPFAALVQGTDGNFYGTTYLGGASNNCDQSCGTVFTIGVGLGQFVETQPTSGNSGAPVTILGTNLTGTTGVTFNGTHATILTNTGSAITTTIPAGATTGTVHVTLPSGTLNSNADFQVTGRLQYVPVTPCRLIDTRQTGGPIQGGASRNFTVPELGNCGIPASAAAYALNPAVVPHGPLGYLTIWPEGEIQPYVSTMNSPDARIKANAAIVPAGNNAISVYATDTTDLVIDIDGYFTAPSSQTLEFYPLTPCRLVDTRGADSPLGGPRLAAQRERDFPLLTDTTCIPAGLHPAAYSLNFAAVPNPAGQQLGYLTVWPKGESRPDVSTLNNPTATVVANAAIVGAGHDGEIAVYPYDTTDLVIDINGYFAAPGSGGYSYYPTAPCRVLDTRNNNGPPFTYTLNPPVNVPDSPCGPPLAKAYVLNAAVVPRGSLGYLTLWPDTEQRPGVATLNAYDGFITSNMAIVPSINGSIDAYAYGTTWLILDLSGYFAP